MEQFQAKKGEQFAACPHAIEAIRKTGRWGNYAWYQAGPDTKGADLVIPMPQGGTLTTHVQWIVLCEACHKKHGKKPSVLPIGGVMKLDEDGPIITDPDLN